MEQLELFGMPALSVPAEPKKKPFKCGRKRANRAYIRRNAPLMDQLQPQLKKKTWRLSFSPKTTILVPVNWTKEQCLENEKKYQGEDGKINHDAPSEQSIFGGEAYRR